MPYGSQGECTFTFGEKNRLELAVINCFVNSCDALKAAKSDFKNHLNELILWFGNDEFETIQYVKDGVSRMHAILKDNESQLHLIDGRNKRLVHEDHSIVPVPFRPERYQKKEIKLGNKTITDLSKDTKVEGFVHMLSVRCNNSRALSHVGSGLKLYITGDTLLFWRSIESISKIIYHELSHKILSTVDTNREGVDVYGEKECKALALHDSARALKHADCWAYFVMLLAKNESCTIL